MFSDPSLRFVRRHYDLKPRQRGPRSFHKPEPAHRKNYWQSFHRESRANSSQRRARNKMVRPEEGVQLIEDDSGAHADRPLFKIEVRDLPIVPGELNNQSVADGASAKLVPAPRGVTETFAAAAAPMTAPASSAVRGKATPIGWI